MIKRILITVALILLVAVTLYFCGVLVIYPPYP